MWFAMDGTMEDEEPSVQQFCVRFKEASSALEFEEIIMKEKDNIPTDKAPPKITDVKVKTEKVEEKKTEEKPNTLASILAQPVEIKEDKKEDSPKKNLFGGLAAAMKESNTSKNTSGGFSFNFGAPKTEEKKVDEGTPAVSSGQAAQGGFSFSFGGGSKPSSGGFGSIAAKGNENAFSNGGFNFANKGKSIFAPTAPPKKDEGGDNEEVEGGDADPYFEPVIELPDLVEVKTGEEGWETIFTSRAKLFRWNDKQWKERGLGECKATVQNTIDIHIQKIGSNEYIFKGTYDTSQLFSTVKSDEK